MLVDTHCHLTDQRYQTDQDEVIETAVRDGVTRIIVPGTDEGSSKEGIELAKKYQGLIYAGVGVHPEELTANNQTPINNIQTIINEKIIKLEQLIEGNREWVVAVGEVGTDASTQGLREKMSQQQEMFASQCEIALKYDLPVIIHTRDSMQETLAVLDQLPRMPRGHFHCWSDSDKMLEAVVARGFYVGFCGNVTYKSNRELQEQAKRIPSERLLIETDSPYLPPQGKRGERNTPANVKITAQFLADLRGQSLKVLVKQTSDNAKVLYGV